MQSQDTDPADELMKQRERERAAVERLQWFSERLKRWRAAGPPPDPDDIMPGEFERPEGGRP